MKYVTSISVGCGFHGGDPHVMRKTVALAKQYGVAVGAHPGFPDPIGFGRRKMEISPEDAKDYILYQVGALKAFCDAAGVPLQHVKPHGQFYNMAWTDEALARAILESVREINPEPIFLALYNTIPYEMAQAMGIRVAGELYADLMKIEEGIPAPARTVSKKKYVTSKEITVTFGMKKLVVPVLAVLAIAAVAIVLLTRPKLDVDPDLVAVAVFENGTGDPSQDMLGRMVADQITAGLSQVEQISVVPLLNILQSSWMTGIRAGSTQGTDQLRALGEETGAGTLVSGIYYMKDGVLQFHTNITDVRQGKIRASFPVEGSKEGHN